MSEQTPRLKHLLEWQAAMREMDDQIDHLYALTCASPESPLVSAVSALMELATAQAAQCADVTQDWLDAWWLDCRFGDKCPLRAGINDEGLRTITTIEELVQLIEDAEGASQ